MKLMLDLYSGLGGASEAFLRDQGWHVDRIENNPELEDVPNTILHDVKLLKGTYIFDTQYDFIWASPPCLEFSVAYNAPRSVAQRRGEPYSPDLSLVLAAKAIIDELKPRYWAIENVVGALSYLKPILGEPRQIVGPFVIWGVFPNIHLPPGWAHSKSKGDTWSSDSLRANRRALIPLEVSEAFKDAIESQRTLYYFA